MEKGRERGERRPFDFKDQDPHSSNKQDFPPCQSVTPKNRAAHRGGCFITAFSRISQGMKNTLTAACNHSPIEMSLLPSLRQLLSSADHHML